jgi:membrane protease YdiL (CAAX protease family)
MQIQDGVDARISKRARSPMAGWLALLLAVIVLVLSLGVCRTIAISYASSLQQTGLWSAAMVRAATYLIILLPMAAWALVSSRLIERRARIDRPVSIGRALGIGAIGAVLMFALVLLALVVTQCIAVEHIFQMPDAEAWLGITAAAVLVAFQAGAEETFFRGWLQPILVTRWGVWPGVAVTAVLFAIAHGILLNGWPAFVNVFLAGLLFGLVALRTGRVAAAFAAHGTWNWLEQSVVGLTPNPGVDPLGSVLDLKIIGPEYVGSGADELTGSLYLTLIFAVFVVILVALPELIATLSAGARHRSDRARGRSAAASRR